MNKLKYAWFALDISYSPLRGYHDPANMWNGWNCPYASYDDIREYCCTVGWECVQSQSKDTIIIAFPSGHLGNMGGESLEYDEFPVSTVDTEDGIKSLYDLSGWIWLEYGRI